METTAEGVETQDEIELIRELGCSHIQGYVFGKPMPNDHVLKTLSGSAAVKPVGLKMSRPPRQKLLRSTRIEHHGARSGARIRDVSPNGMMIDGYTAKLQPGDAVVVETAEGRLTGATVVWTSEGRAGLQLAESQNLQNVARR